MRRLAGCATAVLDGLTHARELEAPAARAAVGASHGRHGRGTRRAAAVCRGGAGLVAALAAAAGVVGQQVDQRVLDAEVRRIAAVDRVKPAVVAVFAAGGAGGGSGVLINKDGYALTNFHVVEGSGPVMQCGLADGVLYDAVLVGLDKVGDVALIKLLPKKEGKDFPFAPLGDSDKVRTGDWSLAMGNPFLLATDFNPTVTYGLVSGVHRYQYPSGTILEYTDCIQIDTSINPGNSGGPLFNTDGELIGINGRGSFEKRGRVNSGVGYAISINQIKNFLGHLRAGLDTDHATLGAVVETEKDEEGGAARLAVSDVLEESDAARRGLRAGDELVEFAGRPVMSVNQYKNVLGLFPKGWRVPLTYRHEAEKHEVLVRLMQLQPREEEPTKPKAQPGAPRLPPPSRNKAVSLYEPKPGFANYHFNRLERDRLWAGFRKHGDFSGLDGDWVVSGTGDVRDRKGPAVVSIREVAEERDASGKPVAREGTYHLKPESLPALPEPGRGDQAPLRQAVRKALELLKKHAKSFPQEFWAQADEEQLKAQVVETQKDVAAVQTALQDGLEELKKAGKDKANEPKAWQAAYDYAVARLTGFVAYAYEYNYLLGQLRKKTPPRDPKRHRGWRMEPQEKLQSGGDGRRLAAEAQAAWQRMVVDYRGTPWEERARAQGRTRLGLRWQPTGGTHTVVHFQASGLEYDLDPLKPGQDVDKLKDPPGSGGFMTALYQYRRLLTLGPAGFEQYADAGGSEPFYPPRADGKAPRRLADLRVDTDVLVTEHSAVPAKWYFLPKDQTLVGFEVWPEENADPCEVYLSDYRSEDGRNLPHRIEVKYGDKTYGVFEVKGYKLEGVR